MALLYNMIATAASAQADFFKLQVFNPLYMSRKFRNKQAFYSNTQLDVASYRQIVEKVEKYGMEQLFTVNTPDKVELLRTLNVSNIKIASGQIHPTLFKEINKYEWDRVMVSTGMLDKVEKLDLIKSIDRSREVVVFHCVSLYPHYDSETNLSRLETLKDYLGSGFSWGYSDHSLDDMACIGAIAMGAEYIERHFMVDNCFGPTSQVCCDGKELNTLSTILRRMDAIMGDGDLEMQKRERQSWEHYRDRFLL